LGWYNVDIGSKREREKEMNSKIIAKELKKMGYTLRKTSDVEARWMVISDVLTYHWNFKDLNGVQRFMVDERAMFRYAREHATVRS
jgi:hypothetical protein